MCSMGDVFREWGQHFWSHPYPYPYPYPSALLLAGMTKRSLEGTVPTCAGGTLPSPLQRLSPNLHQGEAGTLFGNLKPKGMSVIRSLCLGRASGQQRAGLNDTIAWPAAPQEPRRWGAAAGPWLGRGKERSGAHPSPRGCSVPPSAPGHRSAPGQRPPRRRQRKPNEFLPSPHKQAGT